MFKDLTPQPRDPINSLISARISKPPRNYSKYRVAENKKTEKKKAVCSTQPTHHVREEQMVTPVCKTLIIGQKKI